MNNFNPSDHDSPQVLSTSLGFFLRENSSNCHSLSLLTFQSHLSIIYTIDVVNDKCAQSTCFMYVRPSLLTLQIPSPDTSIFLAAKSLWMNDFLSRYPIPVAICWQNLNSMCLSAASEAMTWSLMTVPQQSIHHNCYSYQLLATGISLFVHLLLLEQEAP